MRYKYPHFIKQNVAPPGTKRIVIYDGNGAEVTSIPLGGLTPPNTPPLYSFGLISDIHLYHTPVNWNSSYKFDNALAFFESAGCTFVCHTGDMTQTGLDGDNLAPDQFNVYREICGKHTIPVYGICGNHDISTNPTDEELATLRMYLGTELYYKIEHQNDVFIFCSHSKTITPMSDDAFAFLSETLSANSNKRCFVFVHPIWNDDSGDARGLYYQAGLGGTLLSSWSKGNDLKELLRQYPKAVLFHGHTHIKFQEQEKDKSLNYMNKNGFHSVHVPSLTRPRDIINNAMVYAESESQGYVVDVYDDCIVLNGWDFVDNQPVPLGILRIPT